jgi:hypothetical protein
MTSSPEPYANQTTTTTTAGARLAPLRQRATSSTESPLRLTSLGERVAALLRAEQADADPETDPA